jgi:hypothetical protein
MPLCARGDLASLFRRQGLVDVHEAELTTTLSLASIDDYWEPFLLGQGPAGAYVVGLSHEARCALERSLRRRLLRREADHPVEMTARAWAAKGTVPRS